MSFITLQGASSQAPSPTGNDHVSSVDVDNNTNKYAAEADPAGLTFERRNVIDLGRYGSEIHKLYHFIQGKTMQVTWFAKTGGGMAASDPVVDFDSVEPTYIMIRDFEIKTQQNFEYAYLQDENVSEYNATAYVYPGMVPRIGDLFVTGGTEMRLYRVVGVNRLSIKTRTCHEVTAQLHMNITQSQLDQLGSQVAEELHFDRRAYLDNDAVLLTTSDKGLVDDSELAIDNMTSLYMSRFFDRLVLKNVVRPDDVYDPYVAHFLRQTLNWTDDYPEFPVAYFDPPSDYTWSLWNWLRNRKMLRLADMKTHARIVTSSEFTGNVQIDSLVNRQYLSLCEADDEDAEDYPSPSVYSLSSDDFTSFDSIARLWLDNGQINPVDLFTYVENIRNESDDRKFHEIPVLIFLCFVLRNLVLAGRRTMVVEDVAVTYFPTQYEFTASQMVGPLIMVDMDNVALGIIDDLGSQYTFEDGEVNVVGTSIRCNLMRIMLARYEDWHFASETAPNSGSWTAGSSTITLVSTVGLEPGMAVENVHGIGSGRTIQSVDGLTVTLDDPVESVEDVEGVDVKIDWPSFEGTWTLTLTGNTVEH